MSKNENTQHHVKAVRELAKLAEHASLTGTLDEGRERAIDRYNWSLSKLEEAGSIPKGMYQQLGNSATYSELAVEARLLGASASQEEESDQMKLMMRLAPFASKEDIGMMLRKNMEDGVNCDPNAMVALAPFLDQKDISGMIQMYCGGSVDEDNGVSSDDPVVEPTADEPGLVKADHDSLREIVKRLADPNITAEERESLTHELNELTELLS